MLKPIFLAATVAAATVPGPAEAALIALYKFDSATELGLDSSGNGKDAANFGASFANGGYQGGGALFHGAEWLSAPVDVNRAVLPNLTWGAWVKPAAGGAAIQGVLSNDDGGFDKQIGIDDRAGGGWAGFTGNGVLSSAVPPSTDDWTFLAAVYDQSQSSMTLYVNGQSFTTVTNFGGSPDTFVIGRNQTFASFYSGLIDNVFVYDEALSAAQIADLRATGFGSSVPPVDAVPEPKTWALMLVGFGLAGAGLRRRTSPSTILA